MLVRRNSLLPALRAESAIDSLFESFFGDGPFGAAFAEARAYPAVDTWEDETSFHVEAELPGLRRKDLEISVMGNELRIAGGRGEEKEEKGPRYQRRERFAGKFARVLRFPVEIDDEKVEAKLEDGVLRVTLPKAAAALPRRVDVKG